MTNLIRYYIGCVEAEGLKELVLEAAKRGQQFVVIAGAPEAVMSGHGGEWREISQETSGRFLVAATGADRGTGAGALRISARRRLFA